MRFDVVIIGSGISSLTCAAILAKKGKSVAVIERYRKPGGYLHCFSRFGCDFDTGSHYVGSMDRGQAFHTLLSYLNIFDPEMFVPLDREAFDIFRFPTFSFSMPAGHERAAQAMAEVFPSETQAIRTYFAMVSKIADAFPTYQYNENADANAAVEYLNISLTQVVEKLTNHHHLRCLLYSYCTLHCVHPDDTPFGFHAVMMDSLLRGAYGFRHGGDALARAFVTNIEQAGGRVFLRQSVERFDIENASIARIHTNRGDSFEAEWVVSGIHPKATFDLVGAEHLSPAFLKRMAAVKESVPFLGIYAACREEPPLAVDKNYYAFSSDHLGDFEELRRPPSQPQFTPKGIYLTRNNRSRTPGDRGYFPLTVHAPAAYQWFEAWKESRFADRPPPYHELKTQIAHGFLDFSETIIPGIKSNIESFEVSTTQSNMDNNGSVEGSAYGIYHSIANTGMRGIGPRTHIKNLLLTGQNTLFPGLLASSISGLRSAGHIIGIKPILKELRLHRETL